MPSEMPANMELLKPLLRYLRKFSPVSDAEFQLVIKHLHIRRYKKNEIITQKGEVENYFYFILKGLVRKYYIKNDEEFNTQISHEGHIIHAQESFHSRQPSHFCIMTMEPSILASVHYNDLENIYSQSRKIEHIARLIITHTMVLKDEWKEELLELSQKERFLKFVNRHPELLKRVPQKHLATYLNIKPETFSRYKHLVRSD
jgi:CRP-like cAMP-binding protein